MHTKNGKVHLLRDELSKTFKLRSRRWFPKAEIRSLFLIILQ